MKPITPGDAAQLLDEAPVGLTLFHGPAGSGRSSYLSAYAEWLADKAPQVYLFLVEGEAQFAERMIGKPVTVFLPPSATFDTLKASMQHAPKGSVLLVDGLSLMSGLGDISLAGAAVLADTLEVVHKDAVSRGLRVIGSVQTRRGGADQRPGAASPQYDLLEKVTRIRVP